MTLGEHLEELRRRVLISLATVLVVFIVAFVFQETLMKVVLLPFEWGTADLGEGVHAQLQTIQVTEAFLGVCKVCLLVALLVGAPVALLQMWLFISAGLYSKERSVVMRILPFSGLLFALGIAFGFFVMAPFGLQFLIGFAGRSFVLGITLSSYLNFLFLLTLLQGLAFQLPLIMVVLVRIGLVERATLARNRRIAIVLAFVFAAILTPPDPTTQCLMAVPLIGLYEIGLLLTRGVGRAPKEDPA